MSKLSNQTISLFLATFLLFACYLNVSANTHKTAKIIGGSRANSFAWPWMAGLVVKDFTASSALFCGASLISSNWVLTAAHCVLGENNSSFDVIINRAQLGIDSGERIAVTQIIIHPDYNNFTFENDLALVRLATPSRVSPIQLLPPYSFQDDPGKLGRALGWGTLDFDNPDFPDALQQVDLPLISNTQCNLTTDGITDDMLCAGDGLGLRDTCTGDSGGPLLVFDSEINTWRQAGITSFGIGCAVPNLFGVYTRVERYANFISDIICSNTEIPQPSSLSLAIENNLVTASWTESAIALGYRLNFAPFPQGTPISSVDMKEANQFSLALPSGSAYFVAITSYNRNCFSDFSNIDHFIIN